MKEELKQITRFIESIKKKKKKKKSNLWKNSSAADNER